MHDEIVPASDTQENARSSSYCPNEQKRTSMKSRLHDVGRTYDLWHLWLQYMATKHRLQICIELVSSTAAAVHPV
jgi:hypothetical protein